MNTLGYPIIILIVLSFSSFQAKSFNNVLIIDNSEKNYLLAPFCQYTFEKNADPNTNPLALSFSPDFDQKLYLEDNINFWVRFNAVNERTTNQFFLTIDQWEHAILFIYLDGVLKDSIESGTQFPVGERPASFHRLLSFPLYLETGRNYTFYLKLSNDRKFIKNYSETFNFLTKIELDESSYAYNKYVGLQYFVAFIIGVAFLLLIYNLGLFLLVKQKTYLLIVLYLFNLALFQANINGVTTNYLIRWAWGYELPLGMVLSHINLITINLLLITFFKWRRKDWQWWVLTLLATIFMLNLGISALMSESLFIIPRNYIETVGLIIVMISAVRKKYKGSWFLLTALLCTIVPNHFNELYSIVLTNPGFVMTDIYYVTGVFLQMIFITGGASMRVKEVFDENSRLEKEKKELVEKQNITLQEMVGQKTGQLTKTLQNLKENQEELQLLNLELKKKNEVITKNSQSLDAANKEIRQLNSSLEKLVELRTDELKEALKELDTFLYMSSHNLRRPLTTILGLNNLIIRSTDSEERVLLTQKIYDTITDVDLMLKKLAILNLCFDQNPEYHSVCLASAVQNSFLICQKRFPLINAAIEIPEEGKLKVNGIPELLEGILNSILENSFENPISNRLNIKVTFLRNEDESGIMISDNGRGLDKKYQFHVFDMFYRGHEDSKGYGLGLYLVKRGMIIHNGRAEFDSIPKQGAHLTLFFSN